MNIKRWLLLHFRRLWSVSGKCVCLRTLTLPSYTHKAIFIIIRPKPAAEHCLWDACKEGQLHSQLWENNPAWVLKKLTSGVGSNAWSRGNAVARPRSYVGHCSLVWSRVLEVQTVVYIINNQNYYWHVSFQG